MLDIRYLRALRDALVAEGPTGVHHLLDESGWTTFHLESADDYDHARWLVRLPYLSHANLPEKAPAGAEEYAAAELDRLNPSETVRAAFERERPGKAGASE